MTLIVAMIACSGTVFAEPQGERESAYYELTTLPTPDGVPFEVSGLAPLPDGRMAVAIRRGDIWIASDLLANDPDDVRFQRFATALHEPLGLAWHDGSLYAVQRGELTRITDTDGDGEADEYRTLADGWGITGNYHEYAYGPVRDGDGNWWLTLNCSIGNGPWPKNNAWRGWSMKLTPEGKLTSVSGGLRSPAGLGTNLAGDVFTVDHQGNWVPTCPLIHLEPGAFHGHADALAHCAREGATFKHPGKLAQGLTWPEAAERIKPLRLPAVWLPYIKAGRGATDVLCDTTDGAFGPFAGQMFVGDFTLSLIVRVDLEKVDGRYQGACFRFREGFNSAVLRMAFAEDGSMIVGQTNRGWNSLGDRSWGWQRLRWTGQTPFEIATMRARPDGFVLTFTRPVDAKTAGDASSYNLESYTYLYHAKYGSDEVDRASLRIRSATVSEDRMSVRLVVDGLRAGYVHELTAGGVRDAQNEPLLHNAAYYTLNAIPKPAAQDTP